MNQPSIVTAASERFRSTTVPSSPVNDTDCTITLLGAPPAAGSSVGSAVGSSVASSVGSTVGSSVAAGVVSSVGSAAGSSVAAGAGAGSSSLHPIKNNPRPPAANPPPRSAARREKRRVKIVPSGVSSSINPPSSVVGRRRGYEPNSRTVVTALTAAEGRSQLTNGPIRHAAANARAGRVATRPA